jgi:hypothetical protein
MSVSKPGNFSLKPARTQVFDDRPLKRSPGMSNGIPGGREQYAGHAAFEVVDLHAVDLAMGHACVRVGRLQRRLHVDRYISVVTRATSFALYIRGLLAQVAQADALAGCGAEFRQDPQRLVLVVIVLELLQRGHQRVPPALGDADVNMMSE